MNDDEKIDAFEAHVRDRQLTIARHLADHFVANLPSDQLAQSAFAILSIVTNYFEMIEQFYVGKRSHRKSAEYFRAGISRVFAATEVTAVDAHRLYSFMRCGMYHSAMPTDRCGLSRNIPVPILNDGGTILINPALLVDRLATHFSEYCSQLRGSTNPGLRENMLKLFEVFASDAPTQATIASQPQTTSTIPPWQ